MLEKVRMFFNRSDFLKNVAILTSGGVLAQVISVAISPVLSRIYSPEIFGIFAFYINIKTLFSLAATGRYELAIMLPERDSDAYALCKLAFRISIGVSLAALIIFFFSGNALLSVFKIKMSVWWLLTAVIAVFLTGIFNILNYWNLRRKRFKAISASKVAQGGTQGVVNIGLAVMGYPGLILGQIAGILGSIAVLFKGFGKPPGAGEADIGKNMVRYSNFPVYNLPHTLMDGIRGIGMAFLMTFFFQSASLGLYYFTMKVLNTPTGIIGASISQVYFQKAAGRVGKKIELYTITLKLLVRLVLIGLPIFGAIFAFGPWAFGLFFGERWREAGEYARILSPYIFLSFLLSSLSQLPSVLEKQKENFIFGLIGTLLMLGSFISGGLLFGDVRKSLIISSVVMSAYFVIVIVWYLKIAASTIRGPLPPRGSEGPNLGIDDT